MFVKATQVGPEGFDPRIVLINLEHVEMIRSAHEDDGPDARTVIYFASLPDEPILIAEAMTIFDRLVA